ncbi:MAG: glycosyltransferase family 4 protein [Lachnospiraceae bacterium]|nr:glycosyltransferase family 4 protein [Lachnospiraceae bacterium]
MMGTGRYKVLMIGPDRSVHGGISGVVNNYYEAGLDTRIDLCYIGTMVDGSKWTKLLCAVKAYCRFLVKLPKYDIVHVNMASDASYYRKSVFVRTAGIYHKKIVIHQHGGSFIKFYEKDLSDAGRRRVRKLLSMGDAFLVLGTAWKDFFATIIERDRITVFPNAIQLPVLEKKQYGVHKILFLGRMCKEKGIGELLAVMPKIREKYPDVHLYLGGIWEDRELKAKAMELKDYVTDLGWIGGAAKQNYLRECDIFVMPSYFEGQPVSILEAMANACGIVASRTGGIPDMILEDETGILAMPQDTKTLEEGLCRLLADSALCRRLGENARRKIGNEFSIEDNIEQLLAVYESISCRERRHERG